MSNLLSKNDEQEPAQPNCESANTSWKHFLALFIKSKSLASFCSGYLLLLAVLLFWELPWIGLFLSLAVESVAAGYYLKVMQEEIHGSTERYHLALWPKLNVSDLVLLLKLGLLTNVIQIAYAALAFALSLPVFVAIYLGVFRSFEVMDISTLMQLLLPAALFTSPFSLWVLVVMSPIGLARFAHTGKLMDAFDFAFTYKNIAWGSKLIKGAALIYSAAIVANCTMMTYAPGLMMALEPLIEFSSMAMVCRLNARWYREVIVASEAIDCDGPSV